MAVFFCLRWDAAKTCAAGRRTEVDIFAGKVVELGERYAVSTPANRMMLHLLRTLEETGR